MTRRFLAFTFALAAVLSFAPQAQAQISPGIHVARAADSFDGVNGVGGNLVLGLPILPKVFVAAEYFFPDCDNCSLWGGSADLHIGLPIPFVSPYATAGLVVRNTDVSDTSVRTGGFGIGAGVNATALVIGGFVEGRYELMDGGEDQLVFRLGVRF